MGVWLEEWKEALLAGAWKVKGDKWKKRPRNQQAQIMKTLADFDQHLRSHGVQMQNVRKRIMARFKKHLL